MIKINNISKKFGGVIANNAIDLSFEKGKITALIGPNGCGKSTLFNIIGGTIKPDKGKIFFGEKEFTKTPIHKRSLIFSRVFQKATLFENLTVNENLQLACHNSNFISSLSLKKYNVDLILNKVGLLEKKDFLCRELSYGQKRLIEIARAIIRPHSVLLLDEPVSGVTPSMRKRISLLLSELRNSGETIIIIEHDLDFVQIADRVILMGDGKVALDGTYSNIIKHKTLHETYLGI